MANVLIVYASRTGQTEKVARHIGAALKQAGHEAHILNAERERTPDDLAGFQAIVVGAPVLAGGYPRAIRRFARDHRELLERIPSAFFSVGLAVASRTSDGRAQTREVVEGFVKRTGWRPVQVGLFAGLLAYSRYNFLLRYYMRRIAKHEGGDTDVSRDTEYTDFAEVARFAREFAGRVDSGASVGQANSRSAPSAVAPLGVPSAKAT